MFGLSYKTLNCLTISAAALTHNYHYFQSINSTALIAPVLKSNAYGHGLTLLAKFIDRNLNPPFICVDSLYEAYRLKKASITTPILIMGYTFPQNYHTLKKLPFSFPVYDTDTLRALSKYQPGAKVHLKIDTGMNRLGLTPRQIPDFIKVLKTTPHLQIEGIYSHFSQADHRTYTQTQLHTFKQVIATFRKHGFRFAWRHLASSATAAYLNDPELNLARVGLGFYGYSPFSPRSNLAPRLQHRLRPALALTTHLVQIKRVGQGRPVSYGTSFITTKPTTIGIIPMGYWDGIDRRLSNRGSVMIGETPCPIIGRVCMNLTIIDLTNVANPHIGQQVSVINPDTNSPNSLASHAKHCRTIPYDLLVNLSETTKRKIN